MLVSEFRPRWFLEHLVLGMRGASSLFLHTDLNHTVPTRVQS